MTGVPNASAAPTGPEAPHPISGGLTLVLAIACGLIASNLYYAQPLIAPISAALHVSDEQAGLIVTLTQIGYGLGLLFVVPLGDIVENKRLILTLLALSVVAVLALALSPTAHVFLAAAALVGITSVAVQTIVPYAAHFAPEATRGRVVGNVMSGLMFGIMLARPMASFVAAAAGWRAVFLCAAVALAALWVLLALTLRRRAPHRGTSYARVLTSLWPTLRDTRVLRRRARYHSLLFGCFSLFWTAVPLLLASPAFGLGQGGIGLFALVGAAGAIAAPFAGRAADRGWSNAISILSIAAVALAFPLALYAAHAGSVVLLGVAAVLIDMGISGHLIPSQRALFSIGAHMRGRINGIFMALFFTGGAIGSALASYTFATGGWRLTAEVGFGAGLLALGLYVLDRARDAIAARDGMEKARPAR